jgi:hypothetical protein
MVIRGSGRPPTYLPPPPAAKSPGNNHTPGGPLFVPAATLKGVQREQKELQAGPHQDAAAVALTHQLAARVAVLDGRQKALKLTANAL